MAHMKTDTVKIANEGIIKWLSRKLYNDWIQMVSNTKKRIQWMTVTQNWKIYSSEICWQIPEKIAFTILIICAIFFEQIELIH